MNVGDDTTAGDGGLDEGVELLVTADGQLEVARGDTLHLMCRGDGGGSVMSERETQNISKVALRARGT